MLPSVFFAPVRDLLVFLQSWRHSIEAYNAKTSVVIDELAVTGYAKNQ